MLIDGKEIGAFSFNIETLAYKAILDVAKPEQIKVAEKIVEKKVEPMPSEAQKSFDAKADKALAKKSTDKNDKTKRHPEFNPIPATAEKEKIEVIIPPGTDFNTMGPYDDDDDNDRNFDVDENTGEVIEKSPTPEQIKEFEDSKQPESIADRYHPSHMENDFNPSRKTIEPVVIQTTKSAGVGTTLPKRNIEPVAASRIDDEPETKTETLKENVKDKEVQTPAQTGDPEIGFTEEQW
jgi:hypothetical protein